MTKLKANVIANFIGQTITAVMSIAFVPWYLHFLGVEAYGLIGIFTVLTICLSLMDMGLTPALGREVARNTSDDKVSYLRDLLRSIEIIILLASIIIFYCATQFSVWIATSWVKIDDLTISEVSLSFSLMGFIICLRLFEGIYKSCLLGLQRQVIYNLINVVSVTLKSVGAVGILAWYSPTIQSFFYWQLITSFISLLALILATYTLLPASSKKAKFSVIALKNIRSFAISMLGISALSIMLTQLDKIFLSKILSLEAYGLYALAALISGSLHMLVSPITQAVYPRFCVIFQDNNELQSLSLYHLAAQLVSVIAGSVAIVIIINSHTFLLLWTGNNNIASNTWLVLSILMFGNLIHSQMWIPYHAQLAHGWTRLSLYINFFAVLFVIPALWWATPRFGPLGAAVVWMLLNVGYLTIGAQLMYRKILQSEKRKWYVNDVIIPLSSGFIACCSLKALWQDPTSNLERFFQLACTFLVVTIVTTIFSRDLGKFCFEKIIPPAMLAIKKIKISRRG